MTTLNDIQKELFNFPKSFPLSQLRITDENQPPNISQEPSASRISMADVKNSLRKINSPVVWKLIGLLAHFAYWWILGYLIV